MVNQYMKRFATEMKQVNQLEMELGQLKKQILGMGLHWVGVMSVNSLTHCVEAWGGPALRG